MKQSLHLLTLCVITVVGAMTGSAATTYLWNVATPGANNWNVNGNWTPATGNPGTGDTAIFGITGTNSADSVTPNNVVSVNTTIATLTYSNNVANSWHVTRIPSGTTLTVTGNLTVGGGAVDGLKTAAAMVDAGTVVVGGNVTIGNNGTSVIDNGTILDLSGLNNFVSGSGTASFTIGTGARSVGDLKLAAVSNSITAGTVAWNTANSSSSGSGTVTLGAGTNIVNANNLNVGANRAQCTVTFAGANGGLRVRGAGGTDTDRASMTLGNRNNGGGSGNTSAGTLSLNGHPVDMKLNTLTLGFSGSNPTGNAPGNGTINFDTGVIDATNVNIAISAGTTVNVVANGTINIGTNSTVGTNGVLLVGGGGIAMASQSASSGAATATLNVNGGAVRCLGNIRKTNTTGTATITLAGASLNMAAFTNTIGAPGPIDTFNISDATLTVPAFAGGPSATVVNLNPGGLTNIINITSVPGIGQFQIIAYTGLGGLANFGLGTLPPGYQGYISNNTSSIDLVITSTLAKTDTWRGNINGNWDTSTANWLSGGNLATYAQGDVVLFDDSLTGTPNVILTTNLTPNQVSINNSLASYVFSSTGKISGTTSLTKDGSGSATLAGTGGDDFSGGVIVNNGTLTLDNINGAISGGVLINAGTLRIGNNDSNGNLPGGNVTDNGSLVFARTTATAVATPISGTGTLTQSGSGTLTLSGANTCTGNSIVTNGILALSGSGTVSNSAQVQVSNAGLDVSAISQSLMSTLNLTNSTVTVALNANSTPPVSANALATGGTANQINITSIPAIASYPVTFTVIQSGSVIDGGFNVGLGTLPAATPAYNGSISESVDQTAVLLTLTSGPTGHRPTVSWTGADVPNLNTNWSDRLNWQLPGAPAPADVVLFGNTGTAPASAVSTPGGGASALVFDFVNNIVDADFSVSSLTYSNIADSYHNTYINSGRKLSITTVLTIGALDGAPSAQHGFVNIAGTNATLSVSNNAANMQVWNGNSTGSGSRATLDLSALDTFNATLSRMAVGACTVNNQVNRPSGIVYLAKTNSISAAFQTTTIEAGTTTGNAGIVVADCNGNAGSASSLYLGQVNTINADTIAIGRQKTQGHILFNPIYANVAPYPSVTFQGFSSNRVSIFDVGDGVGNTGTTTLTGDLNLAGGVVSLMADTMNVGRASSGSGGGTSTGLLQFDAGTINVNTLTIGLQPAAGSKVGVGTVGVNSNSVIGARATLVVNGAVNLGQTPSGTASTTTKGTLGITNGLVLANSIVPGIASANTINLAGGTLVVTNPIGSAGTPLDTLTLAPLGTPDNSVNALALPAGFGPGVTVTTLNLDALDTTTNVINIESVGPVAAGSELPLIQYTTMNFVAGSSFNMFLGTLPTGYSGYLTNDTAQSMIALVLTSAAQPQPTINSVSVQSNNLVMSGTNGFANAPYYVVGSTNVTQPLSTWTRVATNVFGPTGNFSFSAPVDKTRPQQFYTILVTTTP